MLNQRRHVVVPTFFSTKSWGESEDSTFFCTESDKKLLGTVHFSVLKATKSWSKSGDSTFFRTESDEKLGDEAGKIPLWLTRVTMFEFCRLPSYMLPRWLHRLSS